MTTSVTTTAAELVSSSSVPCNVVIHNHGPSSIYVGGANVSSTNGIRIPAGQVLRWKRKSGPIWTVADTVTCTVKTTFLRMDEEIAFGQFDGALESDFGYVTSRRFVSGPGTSGTLSTECGFSDSRSIAIMTLTATLSVGDLVTTSAAHGRQVGDAVVFTTGGSLSGTGLTAGQVYFVQSVPSSTTLTLCSTPGGSVLDITGTGTGTHTVTSASPHGFSDERTFTGATGLATDAMNSFDCIPNIGAIADSGTFNHFAGYQFRPKIKQDTSIVYGFISTPEIKAGTSRNTVVTTLRHIAIADVSEQTVAGSPTRYGYCETQYGMHIYALANADYNISIQSDGASARMIHYGRVVLGSNSYSGLDANSHFHVIPQANMRGLYVSGYSLTGSNAYAAAEIAGTWNTTGTPTALLVNMTDTASNAASLLMDLQIGAASKLSVSKAGAVVTASSITAGGPIVLPTYTVATVPSASTYARGQIYVSNESGGATPAFSDGTNWRRYADRAIIS